MTKMTNWRRAAWTAGAAMALTAGGAAAQSDVAEDPCAGVDGACTPIYACIAPDAVFARGRALGESGGDVSARLSTGEACSGFWNRAADGTGTVFGDCDDGRSFFVSFTYLHPSSGTAIGEGATDRGEDIRGWSGRNVSGFLSDAQEEWLGRLRCGQVLYPVS